MDELILNKVDFIWHCDPNDYPRDSLKKVYLVLKVTDENGIRCLIHDNATYDPYTGKWGISYCDFEPKGYGDDGEWQVIAWAYKPTTVEMVPVDLWQRLIEANEEAKL